MAFNPYTGAGAPSGQRVSLIPGASSNPRGPQYQLTPNAPAPKPQGGGGVAGGGGGGSLQQQSYQAYLQGKKSWLPDAPGSLNYDQYVSKYFGGGGGGGGGAGGGAQVGGAQMPYQPGGGAAANTASQLAGYGKGLLDPNSDYFKRLSGRMSEQIGAQTEAQQRAAALRAARSGLGMGASPELMSMQGQIGQAGLEQQGQSSADLALQAPGLGSQMMQGALSGQVGLQGQALSGYLGQQQLQAQQQAQQLQANMQAQQLAAQQAAQQAQVQLAQQQMQQDAMLRQMALLYGGGMF